MSNVVRSGIHLPLEREADRLLMESLRGVTSQEAKKDILTPWKEQDRRSREVYNSNGFADAHVRRGMYHRVANTARPQLNSREGISRPLRIPRHSEREDNFPSAVPDQGNYYDGHYE